MTLYYDFDGSFLSSTPFLGCLLRKWPYIGYRNFFFQPLIKMRDGNYQGSGPDAGSVELRA